MEKFIIKGGRQLCGEVEISGAKNAAVAIIPAVILSDEPCILENVPKISDVDVAFKILAELGAKIEDLGKGSVKIDATNITSTVVPYDLAKLMRASYYFLGSLFGKYKTARVSMPGGCYLGDRPIDQHIKAFVSIGAQTALDHGMIDITAEEITGAPIFFDLVTVGATINTMLAAVKGNGLTVIENAAKEPQIVDVANFLNSMGAEIMGAGTDVIKIRGVKYLRGSTYSIIPDQIEAGTYMVAAAVTGGNVLIKNVIPKHLETITNRLEKIGVNIETFDDSIRVTTEGPFLKTNIRTAPHPGFPTDMQPLVATLLCLAEGTSIITEDIFDDRFRYVDELRRMGAEISVDGKVAVIDGVGKLMGAPVNAPDLRAGAALIVAGLAASGVTEIDSIVHVERGYQDIAGKLRALGAEIEKVSVSETSVTNVAKAG
ncbi:MAG: UDP-N-acetylglucosamine 1-carboxyvinyltransferase [Ruminococcus sp.]|nr:UDP-N-acetylglucosamine 1-carboxyvinyltransferase [Ruminococcus sp.]